MKHSNKILAFLLGLLLIGGLGVFSVTGVLAANQSQGQLPGGSQSQTQSGSMELPNPIGETSLVGLIAKITNFLITYIVMPVAFFMLVLAGFKFITAQGSEEKIKKARQNLIWTVAGVAIVLGAEIILGLLQEALGVQGAKSQWSPLYNRLLGYLNQIIVIIFALATIYFVWGVTQYVRSAGDQKAFEQGKKTMIYGIIGMVIMGGAWGIVLLIKNSLGI
ncbi:MAG: pilin [Patescibacteria group bacterium]